MIAMIFEVWPQAGHKKDYLETAAELRELVESIDGFTSIERFESTPSGGEARRHLSFISKPMTCAIVVRRPRPRVG